MINYAADFLQSFRFLTLSATTFADMRKGPIEWHRRVATFEFIIDAVHLQLDLHHAGRKDRNTPLS
jgi:hypothetical protein